MKYEEVGGSENLSSRTVWTQAKKKKKRENVYHFLCCGWSDWNSNPVSVGLQCMFMCIKI